MTIRVVVFYSFGTLERRYAFRALQKLMQAAGHIKQPTDAARIMTNSAGLAGTAVMFGVPRSMAERAYREESPSGAGNRSPIARIRRRAEGTSLGLIPGLDGQDLIG